MKVYLDVCCLNRPFDDQSQLRIRYETEAIIAVFELFAKGHHRWVVSEVVEIEVLRDPDEERRQHILELLPRAHERLVLHQPARTLTRSLVRQGIGAMDALHVATAKDGGCDKMLSTDDDLLRKVRTLQPPLGLRVENPARWVAEIAGT